RGTRPRRDLARPGKGVQEMTLQTWFENLSIRQKLTVGMIVTSSIGLIISGVAFFWYEALSARSDLQREISTIADMVAAHSTAALAFSDSKAAAETLQAFNKDKRILGAALSGPSGKVLANYGAAVP